MVRPSHHVPCSRIVLLLGLLASSLLPGCGAVPRARMEECQKRSQLLLSENARLKDQALALQSQNRDYADRAVDDMRRLTARDRAIERLERDIQAYQDDRERLAAAYDELRAGLGRWPDEDRTGSESKPSSPVTARRSGNRLPVSRDSLDGAAPSWNDETPGREPLRAGDQTDP